MTSNNISSRAAHESYTRALFDHSPYPVCVFDEQWLLRNANLATRRVLGYQMHQVIGRSVLAAIHPDDRLRFDVLRRELNCYPEREQSATLRVRHRDQSWRALEIVVSNLLHVPSVAGLVVYARDVTEQAAEALEARRQAMRAEALARAAARLSAHLDRAAVISAICDETVYALGADGACIAMPDRPIAMPQFTEWVGQDEDMIEIMRGAAHQLLHGMQTWENLVHVQRFAVAAVAEQRPPRSMLVAAARVPRDGRPVGVLLAVFANIERPVNAAERALLRGLADQAGLALDNADLLADLQASNMALAAAYDATLEGWVRALDLRDKETEGHTQRVTALSVRLARAMGCDAESLVQIRRGALLHDIGKMAIPDRILHKPGPLTGDEWALMQRHPVYAYEWLAPISFLRPALDIPYCHHERWDGKGYPRGLQGTQIPLAAQVFAVVDAWDAIRSERPYKPAISNIEAIALIAVQAGHQFDPQVVHAFLAMLAREGR